MPLLIDGNNLMHALRKGGLDVGRSGLCRLVRQVFGGERIQVVFDGRRPRGMGQEQFQIDRVEVWFSDGRTGDDVIVELIAADTAPRRLTVVSTDRALRRAARRRRCKLARSEDVAAALLAALERPARPPPTEPPEKRSGLTPEQTEAWMRELGLHDQDEQ